MDRTVRAGNMAGEFIHTLGDASQLEGLFNGRFLKGRGEPRLAMVGRSNVGKSSLINALLGGRLAQVSKQPGKTRCIHFYLWKESRIIVADLPGYGFAKASHTERDRWAQFVTAYLGADSNLQGVLVLLDARHGPTDLDVEAIKFLSSEGIPVNFVMTKADSLKTQSERARRKKEAEQALKELGFEGGEIFWVSSKTKDGLKRLSAVLGTAAENST